MNHLHMDSLMETLRQKREAEREQIEALMKDELQRLTASFRTYVGDALNTTSTDIKNQVERVNKGILDPLNETLQMMEGADIKTKARKLRGLLLRPLMVGLIIGTSLLLTICGGSWGVMHLISARIQSEMEEKAVLTQEIKDEQQTFRWLHSQNWGVSLYQDKRGRFVIFPPGTKLDTGWTFHKQQPAVRFY